LRISWNNSVIMNGQFTDNMSGLSVSAKPFVPNVNACEFVPSFGVKTQPQPPAEHPVEVHEENNPVTEDEPLGTWEDEDTDEISQETSEPEAVTVLSDPPSCEEVSVPDDNSMENVEETAPEEEEQIEETPKPKPAPVVEPENLKTNVNIIFIGHVDAGKSTIGGQLLYLTGQVDERTLQKYEREAKEKNRETWYLSWALDTNLEEREKGKTVECGRGTFETEHKHFVLLDAPGHKSFVPNMIGGAAQADIALLVISARKGEFETGFDRGGQTREHAMLAKTAGVKHVIVLINKMDDPTVEWEEARYKEVHTKLHPFMKKTGFKTTDMTFIPCSGFTGANMKERVDPKICDWYKGPSLLEFLDAMPDFSRDISGPLKMLISDRYKDMGTVVIGKLESGTACKGESYTLMPNKQIVKIVTIYGADEEEKTSCIAGENVKMKLSGVEEEEVMPGFVLCASDNLCTTSHVFDAQVVILEHKSIICAGYTAILHIHNAAEEVKLIQLLGTVDKKTGEKSEQKPRFIKQDSIAIARFKCSELTCLERFADFAPMGRFTLRDEGRTIAIGKVLKVLQKKSRSEEAGGGN